MDLYKPFFVKSYGEPAEQASAKAKRTATSMSMKNPRPFLLAFFSAGWLFPMGFAVSAFRVYIQHELEPRIAGTGMMNSFPFLDLSCFLFYISIGWLAIVIIYWVFHLNKVTQPKGVTH